MTAAIEIRVRGDKDILRKLKALPPNMQKKVLQRAAREAMKPALVAARKNAPKGATGNLRRSLKSKALKRNRNGRIGQIISTSSAWFKGKEFYGAFVEFGWHVGKRLSHLRRGGKWFVGGVDDTRKFIEGKHFVEQTYDEQKSQVARRFIELCKRYIETGLPQDKRGAHLRSGGGAK